MESSYFRRFRERENKVPLPRGLGKRKMMDPPVKGTQGREIGESTLIQGDLGLVEDGVPLPRRFRRA